MNVLLNSKMNKIQRKGIVKINNTFLDLDALYIKGKDKIIDEHSYLLVIQSYNTNTKLLEVLNVRLATDMCDFSISCIDCETIAGVNYITSTINNYTKVDDGAKTIREIYKKYLLFRQKYWDSCEFERKSFINNVFNCFRYKIKTFNFRDCKIDL